MPASQHTVLVTGTLLHASFSLLIGCVFCFVSGSGGVLKLVFLGVPVFCFAVLRQSTAVIALKCKQLLGRQDLRAYRNRCLSKDEIAAEFQKNQAEGKKLRCWVGGVWVSHKPKEEKEQPKQRKKVKQETDVDAKQEETADETAAENNESS